MFIITSICGTNDGIKSKIEGYVLKRYPRDSLATPSDEFITWQSFNNISDRDILRSGLGATCCICCSCIIDITIIEITIA